MAIAPSPIGVEIAAMVSSEDTERKDKKMHHKGTESAEEKTKNT